MTPDSPDSPVTGPGNEALALVADVLASWGVRSRHGEWTDRETQETAAKDVLKVLAEHTAAAVSEARDAAVGGLVATFKQAADSNQESLNRAMVTGSPVEYFEGARDAWLAAGAELRAAGQHTADACDALKLAVERIITERSPRTRRAEAGR